MVSENDFYLLDGNRYRGSRYANFADAGLDPQGNISTAANENAANTSVATSAEQPSPDQTENQTSAQALGQPSQGLTAPPVEGIKAPSFGETAKGLGAAALPVAGNIIGSSVGANLALGSTFGTGVSQGVSRLAGSATGGLVGNTGGAATTAALGARGAAAGPAASSSVSKASSGSGIGGAAGAGLGAAAATLIMGGDVKEAAKVGGGTAAGTYIGSAIGSAVPGIGTAIGGFIGGTIGGIFCFAAGTQILMEDGTETKLIEELVLGDRILGGGTILGRGEGFAETLYSYKNTLVTGSHAVFEDGKWIRVEESEHAVEQDIPVDGFVVYPLVTEAQLVVTPWFISADIMEVIEPDDVSYTNKQRIDIMNENEERNKALLDMEERYCNGK